MAELKKEHLVYMSDEMYTPIHYKGRVIKQPLFRGKGNHSVAQLETLCEQFKEYIHQQQIIKQNCMKRIVELKFDVEFSQNDGNIYPLNFNPCADGDCTQKIMKTYKDIYKLPLHKSKYGSWVYDESGNFVFQFESKFDTEGNYAEGWIDFEQRIMDSINGKPATFEGLFDAKQGEIFYESVHVITIRGWGNLTGVGAHNLSSEEAANIQDTFCTFIVNNLNNAAGAKIEEIC